MSKEDVNSVSNIALSNKIKVTTPSFYRRTNFNLFSPDNKTFFCPICESWKPINEFLNDLYKEREKELYVTLLITEIKHFHMKANIKKIIRENPDLNEKINRKAMLMIITDDTVWAFLKKNGIGPDHFRKLKEADNGIKKLLLKKCGLVWK